ncbi:hypothetical protein XBJ2_60063 [Xenorhabdus bovienii str. Jollieti]|uniref:Uncharacterized protein n=2 Tax=Xenorhabdus bovienii TaxID=40576 RepID=D3UYI6_XENBS|nr:hypothetical protein [Xenorhabdus bovienii]CBJ79364.1 hypothetical protein XBJ1_0213 [Xenorhabdus bovienii SS-2004]CDH30207.1 hypothetical protein XBJ2_60063 [Xenorhabdus bovienii str. Jollieti]
MSNKLPAPILPQINNDTLDLKKIEGDIIIKIDNSAQVFFDRDSIMACFNTICGESYTVRNYTESYFEIKIPKNKISPGQYLVHYTVINNDDNISYSPITHIKVIDGTPTTPPSDKEPFIVMGARYADLAVANGLKTPQRLTAWTKEGKPHPVTWTYIGGTPSFTSPFSHINSPFFYDSAPWLPISVQDEQGNKLKINPINVFGNGGTLGLPKADFNDPLEEQYPSAFAVLLNDNTMVGWGGTFGNSYTQSGVKTITTNGPSYAGLNVDSGTLWYHGDSNHSNFPTGSFDDVGAGGNSFFAISHTNQQMEAWGAMTGIFNYPGDGKNVFVGNSFAITIYNPGTEQIQSLWGSSMENWQLDPDPRYSSVSKPRYITSMARGFAVIDESGDLSTWGDSSVFVGFNPSHQDFIQAASITPFLMNFNVPFGNYAVHRDGTLYAWSVPASSSDGDSCSNGVDIATTKQKFLMPGGTPPHGKIYWDGIQNYNDGPVFEEFMALKDVVQITCSANASAALRQDGTVLTWQNAEPSNVNFIPQPEIKNVRAIYSTGTAFLALTADNKVHTWGGSDGGGDSNEVQALLQGKLTYYMD